MQLKILTVNSNRGLASSCAWENRKVRSSAFDLQRHCLVYSQSTTCYQYSWLNVQDHSCFQYKSSVRLLIQGCACMVDASKIPSIFIAKCICGLNGPPRARESNHVPIWTNLLRNSCTLRYWVPASMNRIRIACDAICLAMQLVLWVIIQYP